MARKQTKKLICLTRKEDDEMSIAESGKLINENVRMLKGCQTLEEIKKLLKTTNKYMLFLIFSRLGIGSPVLTRERTRDFYIRTISEYIANGCKNPNPIDIEVEEFAERMGWKLAGQCVKELYDRECGPV